MVRYRSKSMVAATHVNPKCLKIIKIQVNEISKLCEEWEEAVYFFP
jgi:hypothetical protein